MLFMAMCLSVSSVSCGDDDEVPGKENTGGSGNENEGENNNPSLSVREQKMKLESVGRELAGKINASDFREISDVLKSVKDTRTGAISNWFDACENACLEPGSDDVLKNLYTASNFTGEFVLKNNTWVQTNTTKVGHLRFSFNDNSGKSCVLTLKASTKGTAVHHDSFDDKEYYWDYTPENGYIDWEETTGINTFVIPEKVTLELSRAGRKLMSAEINTKVNTNGEFDYTRDAAEINATMTVSDYNITISKAAFNVGDLAILNARFMKGSETIMTLGGSGKGSLNENEDLNDFGAVNMNFDLLGKVRIGAVIYDADRFTKALENAEDYNGNESRYKGYIAMANEQLAANIYFDGNKNSSAAIVLNPYKDYEYDYSGHRYDYWRYETCVKFSDGTMYSYDQYFDEETFSDVIDMFVSIGDDFVRLFDDTILY